MEETTQLTFKEKAKKYLKDLPTRYFITAFSGMAQGLFVTLIAGTILSLIASWLSGNVIGTYLSYFAVIAKFLMGAGIGIGIAYKLNAKPLVVFTAAVTGLIGAYALQFANGSLFAEYTYKGQTYTSYFACASENGLPGNPIGAYVLAMLTVEVCNLYAGKTKLDIVLIPLGMIILSIAGVYVAWPFIKLIDLFAELLVILINAGAAIKIITGIIIAIVMGIILTLPTSSAAIWLAIATSNTAIANPEVFAIAGGAAVAGCSAHMIGFAVTSYRENGFAGFIAQGLGTSMLQIPNIMKKPIVMMPEIISSAVSGLVAVLLGIRCNAAGGGMGTSGLVGLFGVIEASSGIPTLNLVLGIILCLFIIPGVVSLLASEFMRKKKWINFGDMKLPD